jgi:hypothetical protein
MGSGAVKKTSCRGGFETRPYRLLATVGDKLVT